MTTTPTTGNAKSNLLLCDANYGDSNSGNNGAKMRIERGLATETKKKNGKKSTNYNDNARTGFKILQLENHPSTCTYTLSLSPYAGILSHTRWCSAFCVNVTVQLMKLSKRTLLLRQKPLCTPTPSCRLRLCLLFSLHHLSPLIVLVRSATKCMQ